MQSRYLVTGLVVVLAAVTGVLIYQGNQTQSASTSDVTVTETSSAAGTATSDPYGRDTEAPSESATPAASSGDRPATNIPMTKLAPGGNRRSSSSSRSTAQVRTSDGASSW